MKRAGRHLLSSPILWIILLSLIWGVVFAMDLLPILRGGFGWEWNFKPELSRYRVLPLALGLLVYVAVGLWLRSRPSATPLLAWSLIGGIGLSLATVHVRGDVLYRLYSITVSGRTGGWHMAAAQIDGLGPILANWPQFMARSTAFSTHMGTSPPGMVLAYYWAGSLLDRVPQIATLLAAPVHGMLCQYLPGYSAGQCASAWLGMLMPVWGALTVLPLYGLGREVFGQAAARWSVLWWPLVPSFLMFAPLPNVFYPLPALLMVFMLWRGLRDDKPGWVFASGAFMSLLTFATFTFFPLFLLAGWLTLGLYWMRSRQTAATKPDWRWPFKMALVYGFGLMSVWLMFQAAGGSGFWSIWITAEQAQLGLERPYWPWLGLHLNDLFMFSGWPFALLAILAVWTSVRRIRSQKTASEADVLMLALALAIISLDLSGTMRGESGRILLFLTPFLLLAAAHALQGHDWGGPLVTGMQAMLTLVLVVCLSVVGTEFRAHAAPAPPPVKFAASNPPVHSSGARFGPSIQLLSYSGKVDNQLDAQGKEQPMMYLWLTWETSDFAGARYDYQLRPLASGQTQAAGAIALPPFGDEYPTSCWKPSDKALTDRVKVPLSTSSAADWWADLSLIDTASGTPLLITMPDGTRALSVRLGPFDSSAR